MGNVSKTRGVCLYCGACGPVEIDHIVPRVSGGVDEARNRAASCRGCNARKGCRLPSQWLAKGAVRWDVSFPEHLPRIVMVPFADTMRFAIETERFYLEARQ